MTTTEAPPAETEPIEIAKFWKNRKGDAVVVRLTSYNGFDLVDIRTHFTDKADGKLKPGKGFTCNVRLLPELSAALDRATTRARDLGLLRDEKP